MAIRKRVKKAPPLMREVPQVDIDRLEEARVWLCNAIAGDNITTMGIATHVTPYMWKITHRRYRRVKSANKEVTKAGN